jgi:hypothetical protein
MQLVRIWHLRESQGREEKVIWRQKICTKDPERKKHFFQLVCSPRQIGHRVDV